MNFFQILSDIEKVDPEVYDRLDSRRSVFKHMAGVGQKLSAAALPLFVGSVINKAYAQTPAGLDVATVLNFALKLEYLEMYFYQQRTGIQSGISAVNYSALTQIANDEAAHVNFLRKALTAAGAMPINDPTLAQFDFSGSRLTNSAVGAGPFADWRTNPATYFALAQAFEDTGVRAYKGAAPLTAVMANKTVLTAALNIHSIEARHASHIRTIRRGGVSSSTPSQSVADPANLSGVAGKPKSWISGTDGGGPVPTYTAGVYGKGNDGADSTGKFATYGATAQPGTAANVTFLADDNTTQGNLPLSSTTITSIAFPTGTLAFSEAFDEGLDVGTVSSIARAFTIATSTLF